MPTDTDAMTDNKVKHYLFRSVGDAFRAARIMLGTINGKSFDGRSAGTRQCWRYDWTANPGGTAVAEVAFRCHWPPMTIDECGITWSLPFEFYSRADWAEALSSAVTEIALPARGEP